MTPLPHLNRESRKFIADMDTKGDALDALADLRCAIVTGEIADARAAVRTITETLDLMEAGK